jgi:beta-glucosidase
MQAGGVQSCAKHLILNEQEHNRETMSSSVDDRTLHELYLWPFADAVWANTTSVMCSYNQINNTYACENSHIMSDILKDELNFQGYIVSDWNVSLTFPGKRRLLLNTEHRHNTPQSRRPTPV